MLNGMPKRSWTRSFLSMWIDHSFQASYGEVSFHGFDQSVNSFWMNMIRKIFLLFSIAHTSHNFSSRAFFLSSPLFLIRQAGGFTKCGHEPRYASGNDLFLFY